MVTLFSDVLSGYYLGTVYNLDGSRSWNMMVVKAHTPYTHIEFYFPPSKSLLAPLY